jgi:hypothetical protein
MMTMFRQSLYRQSRAPVSISALWLVVPLSVSFAGLLLLGATFSGALVFAVECSVVSALLCAAARFALEARVQTAFSFRVAEAAFQVVFCFGAFWFLAPPVWW